jgi:hypothetical protein
VRIVLGGDTTLAETGNSGSGLLSSRPAGISSVRTRSRQRQAASSRRLARAPPNGLVSSVRRRRRPLTPPPRQRENSALGRGKRPAAARLVRAPPGTFGGVHGRRRRLFTPLQQRESPALRRGKRQRLEASSRPARTCEKNGQRGAPCPAVVAAPPEARAKHEPQLGLVPVE